MQRSMVVLPEPLGPMTASLSPWPSEKLTPRSTSNSRKRLESASTRSSGGPLGPEPPRSARGALPGSRSLAFGGKRVRLPVLRAVDALAKFLLRRAVPEDIGKAVLLANLQVDAFLPERGDRLVDRLLERG